MSHAFDKGRHAGRSIILIKACKMSQLIEATAIILTSFSVGLDYVALHTLLFAKLRL